MIERLLAFLAPPRFANDPDRTQQAALLHVVLVTLFFILLVAGPLFSVVLPGGTASAEILSTLTVLLVMWGALLLFLRTGRVRLVAVIVLIAMQVSIVLVSMLSNGIRNTVHVGQALFVIFAALIFGPVGGFTAAAVATVVNLALYAAQTTGIYAFDVPAQPVPADIVLQAALFFVSALLMSEAIRRQQTALKNAQSAAEALERTRQELEARVDERTQALSRRAMQLQAAADVARAIATIDDLDQLLTQVTYLISAQYGYYHIGIFLIDDAGEYAVLRAANSPGGQRMLARNHRLRVGEQGIVGYATGFGQARIALDVGADAVFFNNPDLPETRSEMALPLRQGGQVIGALDVQSNEPNAFTQEDVQTLQTLADSVAVAISNVQLLEQLQRSLQAERQAAGNIARQGWERFLQARGEFGYRTDGRHLAPVSDGQGEWHPDMVDAHRFGLTVRNSDHVVAIPLKLRNQVVGAVRLQKRANDAWTAEEIDLMETLTEQLGVALESARLYADTRRRAANERLTSDITTQIRETLDMDTVLQTAIRALGERLGLARVEVRLATPNATPLTEGKQA